MKILLSGEGGQGIQIMAKIFANVCNKQNYEVVLMPHYGVEMRMGISLAYLQIEDNKQITYPKFKSADIIVCLTSRDIEQTKSFSVWGTKIINVMNLEKEILANDLPKKSLNMIALGMLVREFKQKLPLDTGRMKDEIKHELSNKPLLEKNLDAFMFGINSSPNLYSKSLNIFSKRNLSPYVYKNKNKEYYNLPNQCKGCGICIEKCPVKALSFDENKLNYFGAKIPKVDLEKCIGCKICEKLCPNMAIKVIKK